MGKESGKSTKINRLTEKATEFKETVIKFKGHGRRSAIEVRVKHKLSKEYISKNIKLRLKRTVKNFDRIWTNCPNMPAPVKGKNIVIKITIHSEYQSHFQGLLGYTIEASFFQRQTTNCYVYQQGEKGAICVQALEHEFAHALVMYWLGDPIFNKNDPFDEGNAELIAHGWKVCSHFQELLNDFSKKYSNITLKDISWFQGKNLRGVDKLDSHEMLPYIKLAFLREKDPHAFGQLIKEMRGFTYGPLINEMAGVTYKRVKEHDIKFSSDENNDLFKKWVEENRSIRAKDKTYIKCPVDFPGDVYSLRYSNNHNPQENDSDSEQSISSISSSAFFNPQEKSASRTDSKHKLKGIDTLSDLFKHPETTELLEIWGIRDINTLDDKLNDFCERPHPHFLENIKLAAEERALFSVYSVCGLECMQEDPEVLKALVVFQQRATHYIKNYREGDKTCTEASRPQQRKLLRQLFEGGYNDIYLAAADLCGVQNTYRTLYDFYSFARKIDTIFDEEKICKKILSAIDPKESFRKIANKKLSEITAQPMVPPSKSAPNVAKEPTKHKTSQDKHKHEKDKKPYKKSSSNTQESHPRSHTRRPKP